MQVDRAVHRLEAHLPTASTERAFDVVAHELAVHRQRVVRRNRAVDRFGAHLRIEPGRQLRRDRPVHRGEGHRAGIAERVHADPHAPIHGSSLDRALGRHRVHFATHGMQHQGRASTADPQVAHHGRCTQAHVSGQPDSEVHDHVVAVRPVHLVVLVLRTAARVAAGPQGAHRNAPLVGLGDESNAAGVGRPIGFGRADFHEGALGGLDRDRAARVADPHPLLGSDFGPVVPRAAGDAGTIVGAAVEFIAKVAQRHGEVPRDALTHPPHEVAAEQPDTQDAAEQHDSANDFLAPRFPEPAHPLPPLIRS